MHFVEGAPARVAVLIPSFNGVKWLPQCLDALAEQTYRDFEILVIDDGSSDDSIAALRHGYPHVDVLELDTNRGFAYAVNAGIEASRGDYVALLNNDTKARPGWLEALARRMDASAADVGGIASLMLQLDDPGRVDDAGDVLSWTGAAEKRGHGRPAVEFREPRDVFSPCAGAALYRRSFLTAMRGLDEIFFAYLEDIDLGLRGRIAGYRFDFEPGAEVLHAGQGTGTSRSRYVRWITRNRLMTLAKNIPLSSLIAHAPQLVYGQLYFLCAYHKPLDSLAGYVSFCAHLPHVLRERGRIAKSRTLERDELDHLLSNEMNEPSLRELILRRLARPRS